MSVHEHKASGFILTLNEKLANYSSNLINMQTDICYLGVNSRALSWGRGTYVHLWGYCEIAAWDSPHPPESGAPHPREGKELGRDGGQPGTHQEGGRQRGGKIIEETAKAERQGLLLERSVEQRRELH